MSQLLKQQVVAQLKDHVSSLARRYQDNAFHCFEHACHGELSFEKELYLSFSSPPCLLYDVVTMSVDKLLSRVVAPELDLDQMKGSYSHGALASHLHDYTHGINSDPLLLFGMVYAALIHDVDHRGVSNAQFEKEDPEIAARYRHKSVAEQNSLDIAWSLLMTDGLSDLRAYLFDQRVDELRRFRQVVANTVLATDIFDKELNDLRKKRWASAFSNDTVTPTPDHNDRRATIVIEHLIQASDVSHTMQHWRVYRKWNERLFEEMYVAHRHDRMKADPSTFWYQGELGFFDNYIIPLAKKLKECNVFGVSSGKSHQDDMYYLCSSQCYCLISFSSLPPPSLLPIPSSFAVVAMINLCVRRRVPDIRNAESGRMEGTGRSHRGSHGAETVTTSPRRRCRRCRRSHHNASDQFEPFPDRCLNMHRNDNATTTTKQQDYNNNDKYNNNNNKNINNIRMIWTGKNTCFIANYRCDDIGIHRCRSS
jgi:hypothetical protein